MPDWNWNESQSEDDVVHQSTANTDHNDAGTLKQGYDYANFSEITPTPLRCYPLHEDSGTTANDLAGTNDGTISGATIGQTGLLGTTAYSFDGTDDTVSLPPFSKFSSYTLCGWAKFTALNDGTNDSIFQTLENNAVIMRANGNGTLAFYQDGGSGWTLITSPTITQDEWVFATLTWDGSTATAYLNGSFAGSSSISGMGSKSNGDAIGSGAYGNQSMEGLIGEVRIYDTALSASQVQTLYDVATTQGTWTGSPKTL